MKASFVKEVIDVRYCGKIIFNVSRIKHIQTYVLVMGGEKPHTSTLATLVARAAWVSSKSHAGVDTA